jgi:hypothetical protein
MFGLFTIFRMGRSFTVDTESNRQYRRFNATGTQLTVRLLPPPDDVGNTDPMSHFVALDKLVVNVHAAKMPVGFGGIKSKGRPLEVMAHLKRNIVQVKAETNCLAQARLVAKARVDNDPNYDAYRKGRKIRPAVQQVLETIGIRLDNGGGGIPELAKFQEHFNGHKIVVYTGLLPLFRQFLLLPNGSNKFMNILADCSTPCFNQFCRYFINT